MFSIIFSIGYSGEAEVGSMLTMPSIMSRTRLDNQPLFGN